MSCYTVQVNTGIATSQNIIHTWIQINKPDGTTEAWGLYPNKNDIGNTIYGPGDVRSESPGASTTASSGPMPISPSQYESLKEYIKQSNITPPNYSIPLGSQCTNWALMELAEAGIIPRVLGPDAGWSSLQTLICNPLWQQVAWFYRDLFTRAKNWLWPRDPILLDLDGDGLETVGLAANIHFDFDADGVLTKTGWAGRDDTLLVWDRYTSSFLTGTNWQGLADFDALVDTLPQTAGITALLDEFKVRTLTGGDDNAHLTDKADIVLAGESLRWWDEAQCANEMWRVAV